MPTYRDQMRYYAELLSGTDPRDSQVWERIIDCTGARSHVVMHDAWVACDLQVWGSSSRGLVPFAEHQLNEDRTWAKVRVAAEKDVRRKAVLHRLLTIVGVLGYFVVYGLAMAWVWVLTGSWPSKAKHARGSSFSPPTPRRIGSR